MQVYEALGRALDLATRVLEHARPATWGRPTACAEWDVRAVARHLVVGADAFADVLLGRPPDLTGAAVDDTDLAGALLRASARSLVGWAGPGALQRRSGVPGVPLADLHLLEAVVHGHDLAVALRRPYDLDDEAVELTLQLFQNAPLDRPRAAGDFAPQLRVGPARPALEQLLGVVGRRPG